MVSDYTRPPESGNKPEVIVIFFHGYGSSADLMRQYVGDMLGPMLPDAQLRFPDGPIQMGWNNHSWFDVQDVLDNPDDQANKATVAPRAAEAAKAMNDYVSRVMAEEGVSEKQIILAGFSQGGTMAYYTGLLRDEAVGGVYALSGGALENLQQPKSMPPVGLVAGGLEQQDYSGAPQADKTAKLLRDIGFAAESYIIPGQEHQITPKAMDLLAAFTKAAMRQKTGEAKPAPRRSGMKPS